MAHLSGQLGSAIGQGLPDFLNAGVGHAAFWSGNAERVAGDAVMVQYRRADAAQAFPAWARASITISAPVISLLMISTPPEFLSSCSPT
mgnify:CR=1 FL=1